MKTTYTLFVCLSINLLSILFSFQEIYSQTGFDGNWEGVFMNDFNAQINFSINNQKHYEGAIKMFSGENIIQDDKLVNIDLSKNQLTFFIPAKETSFEGSFNDEMTELSGNFIFPDGVIHTIHLHKYPDESDSVEAYIKLKAQLFTVEQLKSDLAFLYTGLKEHHPELYTIVSEDSMDVLLQKLKNEIDTPLTLENFFFLATQLTDAVHCSHTAIRLPIAYQNLTNRLGNHFPCKLFFSKGKAFYISGCTETGSSISPGDEIISINDIPVDQIIEKALYYIPSEGCNTTTKYNTLNRRFNELFYFISDTENFLLHFNTGSYVNSTTIPSSSLDNFNPNFGIKENINIVTFKYIENMDAGILKVPTFGIQNMDFYLNQLDSIFTDLQATNTQHLILDLRDNDGGHPIFAAQLLSYLTNKDFVYFKRNDAVEEFEPLYNPMPPNEVNFDGKIYVLVNGGCLSTTGHLISLLKFNTTALFIGEDPGSTFRCNDFSVQLTLPNTGIELNVARTKFETAVNGFKICEPFPIDYRVNNTLFGILAGEDAILKKAEAIIID